MSTEEMIKELRRLSNIESKKPHYIGEPRWDIFCNDVAIRLEFLNSIYEKLCELEKQD